MDKTIWGNLFLYLHFIGFGMIMSLPVSAIMLQGEMGKRDFGTVSRLGVFLGQMDRVAQYGAAVLLLTGIGLMWAHDITLGSLGTRDQWLGVKLVLFAILIINGIVLAGPGIRDRVTLLLQVARGGEPTPAQDQELVASASRMKFTGIPQIVLLALILILASFGYVPGS